MKFSLAAIAAFAAAVQAAVIPTTTLSAPEPAPLEKRDIVVTLLTALAEDVLSSVASAAVTAAVSAIQKIGTDWNAAREQFTQVSVNKIYDMNPDTSLYAAAVCCNVGYTLKDSTKVSTIWSIEIKSGALHTDYDCMYLKYGNTFYRDGDGGYQNVAYEYASSCSYSSDGTLRC